MNKYISPLILLALSSSVFADQVIKDYISNEWPDSRYEVHDDGTVTDTVTGLMWMRCSLGQDPDSNCSGSASSHDWKQALEAAKDSTFANYSDWRLPNIKELASLVALDRHEPAINNAIFPNTVSDVYWSASPTAEPGISIWQTGFGSGDNYLSRHHYIHYVRLVRSSQ